MEAVGNNTSNIDTNCSHTPDTPVDTTLPTCDKAHETTLQNDEDIVT